MVDTVDSPKRRAFMLRIAPALGVASVGIPACDNSTVREQYQPTFFTAAEWQFITAAVRRLIPDDDANGGGVQAGVPEFIDRQLEMPYGHGAYFYMRGPYHTDLSPTLGYQLPYTPRELYQRGIANADRSCTETHGARFAALPSDKQDAFLSLLEANKVDFDGPPAGAFFAQLLENVKEGYLADPMYGGNKNMVAWKLIGFPGARADFTDWMDQQGRAYPYGPVSINGSRK